MESTNSNCVISIFEDKTNQTSREKYTTVWIKLVNYLINSSMFLPEEEKRT